MPGSNRDEIVVHEGGVDSNENTSKYELSHFSIFSSEVEGLRAHYTHKRGNYEVLDYWKTEDDRLQMAFAQTGTYDKLKPDQEIQVMVMELNQNAMSRKLEADIIKETYAHYVDTVRKAVKELGYQDFADTSDICDEQWLKAFTMITGYIKTIKADVNGSVKVPHLPKEVKDLWTYYSWLGSFKDGKS